MCTYNGEKDLPEVGRWGETYNHGSWTLSCCEQSPMEAGWISFAVLMKHWESRSGRL